MSTHLAPGTQLFNGRYTLQSKLGEGGMASVWSAKHTATQEEVVLKVLRSEVQQDDERREMFLEEARLSAQLHHPFIVEIHSIEHSDGLDLLFMERVWGRPLDALLHQANQQKQFIPWPIAVKLISMACEALHYANVTATSDGQVLKLVHRDIKPANLLITVEGTLKVIDFGIAKATTSQIKTRTGLVKGTVAYMSPEQLHATTLDIRSDLHALGVVLYQLCSGQRPYSSDSVTALMLKILNEPPTPIQTLAPHLPVALVKVIGQLLEKDKEHRPPTALSLQLTLEELLRKHKTPVRQSDLQHYARHQFPELFQEWEARFPELAAAETAPEVPTLKWANTPHPSVDSDETLPQRRNPAATASLKPAATGSLKPEVQEKLAQLPPHAPTVRAADTPLDIEQVKEPEVKPSLHTMASTQTQSTLGGSDDTLTAPSGTITQPGKPPPRTLPEDQVPQFFKVNEQLAHLPVNSTVADPGREEASRWVSDEHTVWEEDDDETVYQRSTAAEHSKKQEATTVKEAPPNTDVATTLEEESSHPKPSVKLPSELANLPADGALHAATFVEQDDDETYLERATPAKPPTSQSSLAIQIAATLAGLGLAALLWWWFK